MAEEQSADLMTVTFGETARASAEEDDTTTGRIKRKTQQIGHSGGSPDLQPTSLQNAFVSEVAHPAVSLWPNQTFERLLSKAKGPNLSRDPCIDPQWRLESTDAFDFVNRSNETGGAHAAPFVAKAEERRDIVPVHRREQ
jgi:hypothetical protein